MLRGAAARVRGCDIPMGGGLAMLSRQHGGRLGRDSLQLLTQQLGGWSSSVVEVWMMMVGSESSEVA